MRPIAAVSLLPLTPTPALLASPSQIRRPMLLGRIAAAQHARRFTASSVPLRRSAAIVGQLLGGSPTSSTPASVPALHSRSLSSSPVARMSEVGTAPPPAGTDTIFGQQEEGRAQITQSSAFARERSDGSVLRFQRASASERVQRGVFPEFRQSSCD